MEPPRRSNQYTSVARTSAVSSNCTGPIGLLLDDYCAIANIRSSHHIADFDLQQLVTAQLAVDGEIKQCLISETALAIEMEADRPNLLLRERSLGLEILAGVQGRACLHGRIKSKISDSCYPQP